MDVPAHCKEMWGMGRRGNSSDSRIEAAHELRSGMQTHFLFTRLGGEGFLTSHRFSFKSSPPMMSVPPIETHSPDQTVFTSQQSQLEIQGSKSCALQVDVTSNSPDDDGESSASEPVEREVIMLEEAELHTSASRIM